MPKNKATNAERRKQLEAALNQYFMLQKQIPVSWIEEYNNLLLERHLLE